MRVLLLGPPGAGKGTQAVKLAEKLGIPQISTGELFRRNIEEGTKLGVEAKRYLDAGDLVPSDLTNELVDDRLNNPDAANGFILDGYPRSVEQAKALHEMLERRGTDIDAVLEFRVSEEVLLERLKGAWPRRRHRRRHPQPDEGLPRRDRAAAGVLPRPIEDRRRRRHHGRGVRPCVAGSGKVVMRPLARLRGRRVVPQRSAGELDAMAAAGAVVAAALRAIRAAAAPGTSSLSLDEIAESVIRESGATPSFLGYHGYPASICASINDRVVHGIPSTAEVLAPGDLVSIDCGAVLDGWHGDAAITFGVGALSDADEALSEATRESLQAGIAAMVVAIG